MGWNMGNNGIFLTNEEFDFHADIIESGSNWDYPTGEHFDNGVLFSQDDYDEVLGMTNSIIQNR
jgi:hypothetical protein